MGNRRKVLRIALPSAAVLLLAGLLSGAAGASGGAMNAPNSANPPVVNPVQHCNFDARTREQRCFDTLGKALADARGGVAAKDDGQVIQGTFFENPDFGGASYTVYGEKPCEKNDKIDYQLDLPDEWKNKISSVQPWANCWIWLYPQPGLGGDRDGPFKENSGRIGALMDDRSQSIGFS
jgi:hypothetical protein